MARIVAITGATGFIGARVAHVLNAAGWQVRALVRRTSNRCPLSGIPCEQVEGDLGSMSSLSLLLQDADAVVHCAGAVRGLSLDQFARINSVGVARLVEAGLGQQPAPRFVLMSSLAAREPGLSAYAASKRQGEEALARSGGGMSWAIFRPPVVYGPGDREVLPLFRLMSHGVAPVLGSSGARFSLLYVDDLAAAVAAWLACNSSQGQDIFEVHDGEPNGYAWGDLARVAALLREGPVHQVKVPASFLMLLAALNACCARLGGYAPMLTPGKVRELRHTDWVCDNARLSSATGWAPRFRLEEGWRRTLQAAGR